MTDLKKVVNDSVGISENGEWTLLKDPLAEIQKAVNGKDYFKIVAYACSIFEFCGKQVLVWQSKKKGKKPLPMKTARNMKLETIIDVLSRRGIISETMEKKMHDIRKLRNSFIHKKYSLRLSSQKAKELITVTDDIIECNKFIKEEYEKIGTTSTMK